MQINVNPIFAQHLNFGDSPTSLFNVNIPRGNRFLVGSNRGRCYQLSLDRFDKLELIYEDQKQRQIIAIGFWPFTEESINQSSKENPIIWLHFRASAISLFELIINNDCQRLHLSLLRELTTEHYGFCQAFADSFNGRIFIPDHEDLISTLRVRYRNGGETIIRLEVEFLNKKLEMQGENGMFKGMIMGIEQVEKADNNCVLLAFEDSTICVFNWRTNAMRDALKHPKHCEFLCWSLLSKTSTNQSLIAVSVVGQLYLLSYFDDNNAHGMAEMLRAECVIRKCKDDNSNCTSVALSNNIPMSKDNLKNGPHCQIGVGLKNGTILIYSLQSHSGHSSPRWSHQLLAQCTNAHSNSIQCLRWIPPPCEESAHSASHPLTPILCSGGDEKISFFEFPTSLFPSKIYE